MRRTTIILSIFIFVTLTTQAQFVEDALRYTTPNSIITARTGGLGVAYHGIADDIGALIYNPAGLSLIQKNEMSFGLGFNRNTGKASYFGYEKEFKSNSEYLTHFALASPIKLQYGKATFAVGYFLENDFDNVIKSEGLNSKYSMIASETYYGSNSVDDNWAYTLYLADRNSNGQGFNTPYIDSLAQTSFTKESGGLHNVSGGAGIDLNENVSIGISLTGKWGSYKYNRIFTESDALGVYNNTFIDGYSLNYLETNENLSSTISGLTGAVGVQVRILELMRFSAKVKFPTWYQIDENFSSEYTAFYKSVPIDGKSSYYFNTGNLQNSYSITTPFVYAAGFSTHISGLTFAVGIEYTDASQISFSDNLPQFMNLNNQLIMEIIGIITWGFAAEYELPFVPIAVRASFSKTTSPYTNDIENSAKDIIGLGASFYIDKNIRIDALMRFSNVSELRTNYSSGYDMKKYTQYTLLNEQLNIGFGVTYRY